MIWVWENAKWVPISGPLTQVKDEGSERETYITKEYSTYEPYKKNHEKQKFRVSGSLYKMASFRFMTFTLKAASMFFQISCRFSSLSDLVSHLLSLQVPDSLEGIYLKCGLTLYIGIFNNVQKIWMESECLEIKNLPFLLTH